MLESSPDFVGTGTEAWGWMGGWVLGDAGLGVSRMPRLSPVWKGWSQFPSDPPRVAVMGHPWPVSLPCFMWFGGR